MSKKSGSKYHNIVHETWLVQVTKKLQSQLLKLSTFYSLYSFKGEIRNFKRMIYF